MNFSLLTRSDHNAIIQSRISPVSRCAILVTFVLLAAGILASIATKFTFASLPNIMLLVMGVLALDVVSQMVPRTKIIEASQTVLYGVLYLVITSICGVLAVYAMQRFAFPLQDHLLTRIDTALGLSWSGYAHWVDKHVVVQTIFHVAYDTMAAQIALPLLILGFSSRLGDVRAYLLAFAIAFVITIFVSALMPAAGPIGAVDRSAFDILRFTGATPLDHLVRLREAGPLILDVTPGGIATFPSFHATVAVLTPLALRGYPRIFVCLLILDAAMLGSTVTEGAHYFVDVLAGGGMAFFAYAMAKRIIRLEDRSFPHHWNRSINAAGTRPPSAAHIRLD